MDAEDAGLSECKTLRDCREYVKSFRISAAMFEPKFDVCFCNKCCEDRGDQNIYERGSPAKPYGIPKGWAKFGIVTHPGMASALQIFEKWHVAYHGTRATNVKPIVERLQLLKPGDKTADGTEIAIREGHIKEKSKDLNPNQIFFSPSPIYIDSDIYAVAVKRGGNRFRVALQLRVEPGAYGIGPETIGARGETIDKRFSNSEIEWFTENRGTHVITGLLVKKIETVDVEEEKISWAVARDLKLLAGQRDKTGDGSWIFFPLLVVSPRVFRQKTQKYTIRANSEGSLGRATGILRLRGFAEAGLADHQYKTILNKLRQLGCVSTKWTRGKIGMVPVSPEKAKEVCGVKLWAFFDDVRPGEGETKIDLFHCVFLDTVAKQAGFFEPESGREVLISRVSSDVVYFEALIASS